MVDFILTATGRFAFGVWCNTVTVLCQPFKIFFKQLTYEFRQIVNNIAISEYIVPLVQVGKEGWGAKPFYE